MPTVNNTKQVAAALLAQKQFFESSLSDITFAAMNAGMAMMKQRIFNNGLDANKKPLAPYISKSYIKKRQKAGRQIIKKDLQFTGSLFTGIEVRRTNGVKSVIQFTTNELADIGHYQEGQVANIRTTKKGRGTAEPINIFTLNEDEQKAASKVGMELIKQLLK